MDLTFGYSAHLIIIFLTLLVLTLIFVWLFLIRGIRQINRLSRLSAEIEELDKTTSKVLSNLSAIFEEPKKIERLWSEFEKTLHIKRGDQAGQQKIIKIRSTLSADVFFNSDTLADNYLHAEFFKHLPGIFTGIGIIGTFWGLIAGLNQFQVSENAATVRISLESLMHSVGEAFIISGGAIFIAMLVTLIEKVVLTTLYAKADTLANQIDEVFESSEGEQYLSRLTLASESSLTQAKNLNDVLINDLKEAFVSVAEKQLHANREMNRSLGQEIADSIKTSLAEPLDKIAGSVTKATGEQGSSAVRLLEDLMSSFTQKLEDLFGGQMRGISELNDQTAQGMKEAAESLKILVGQIEESGKKTTDNMSAQLVESIKAIERHHANSSDNTFGFVEKLSQLVESSQTDTQNKVQETIATIGLQTTSILDELRNSQEKAIQQNAARENSVTERTSAAVNQMTGSVENAVDQISAASKQMADSVSALSSSTASAIGQLNEGASTINTAAAQFVSAGDRVSAVMDRAATTSSKLTELTGALTSSSSALSESLRDSKGQREATGQLLEQVRQALELAKKDMDSTSDLVRRIEQATSKLGEAQVDISDYLDGVSAVLERSSASFRGALTQSLGTANQEFHNEMNKAVSLLAGTIQEFEGSISSLNEDRQS